jgi:hypothetical protein
MFLCTQKHEGYIIVFLEVLYDIILKHKGKTLVKIIQAARTITKMSIEELENIVATSDDQSQIYAAIQEAYNRDMHTVFLTVAKRPEIFKDKRTLDYTINYLAKIDLEATKPMSDVLEYGSILNAILEFTNGKNEYDQKIMSIALKSPSTTALVLLNKNTPTQTINSINNKYRLNIPSITLPDNPILDAIYEFTLGYVMWENVHLSLVLLLRVIQSPLDKFINEVSKNNLSFEVANVFLNAAKQIGNEKIKKNMESSTFTGSQMATKIKTMTEKGINGSNINEVKDVLKNASTEYAISIWKIIENSANNMSALTGGSSEIDVGEPILSEMVFTYVGSDGKSIVDYMIEKDPSMVGTIVDFAQKHMISDKSKGSASFSRLIRAGLNNPSTKNKVLELPKDWFRFIMLTPQDRNTVKKHFDPIEQEENKVQEEKDVPKSVNLEELFGTKKTWYRKYSSTF